MNPDNNHTFVINSENEAQIRVINTQDTRLKSDNPRERPRL